MRETETLMMGWLKIIDTVGSWLIGVGFCGFVAWHGWFELYRWSTTGKLLARYGSRPSRWELITYESDPSKFTETFVVEGVMAALLGSVLCFAVFWDIRKWWINKPKPTAE